MSRYCYSSDFIDEESKGKRCKGTRPRSHCRQVEELRFEGDSESWLGTGSKCKIIKGEKSAP